MRTGTDIGTGTLEREHLIQKDEAPALETPWLVSKMVALWRALQEPRSLHGAEGTHPPSGGSRLSRPGRGQNSGRSAGGPPLAIACADFRPGTRNWVRHCRSISFRRFSNAHLRRSRLLRSLLRNRAEQFDHRFHGRRASGAEAMALRDPGRIVIGEPSLAVSIFPDERFEGQVDAG
jgi:hypothetical protein